MMTLLLSILLSFSAFALGLPQDQLPQAGAFVNSDGGPLIPLLKNAKQKIDIEIYTMNDPFVRSLLRDAMARGVRLRILKDPKPFGASCDLFGTFRHVGVSRPAPDSADCVDQKNFVKEVNAKGGVFAPFNKASLCPNGGKPGGDGCFEHGKIALVDGLALLSTGNFDGTNLCLVNEKPRTCNRDYSLILSDRLVVDTLERIFEADLKGKSYDVRSLIPAALTRTLTVSPFSLKPLVDFVDSARNSIDLEAQYLKDPDLNAALSRAAKRGVKVSLTIASPCSFGRPKAGDAEEVRATYSAFDQQGVSTRMFTAQNKVNGRPGYMHAKVIVVDSTRAWVGSVNGSTGSLTQNREYGYIFDSVPDVQTVQRTTVADHESSDTESWSESLNCLKDPAGKAALRAAASAK